MDQKVCEGKNSLNTLKYEKRKRLDLLKEHQDEYNHMCFINATDFNTEKEQVCLLNVASFYGKYSFVRAVTVFVCCRVFLDPYKRAF